ncbi:MAG: hypothetical protein ABTQ32_04010 [Myxococcaceae bacterium]
MDAARIQLEGKLEHVEQALVVLRQVSASIRDETIGPRELASLTPRVEALEALLPQLRRHADSAEVTEVLVAVRKNTETLVRSAARLCRTLGLPAPRSVHEVRRFLEPHVRIRLSTRLIARGHELVVFAATFAIAMVFVSLGMPPLFLIAWLVQAVFLATRSVPVVVSASSLRLGRFEWRLRELRHVHFEIPGWAQQRGQRVVVVVETVLGRTTRVKVPNAVDGLMAAVRAAGVPVSRSGLNSWWSS